MHALATAEVTGDYTAERQASWERQALGQAELDGGLGRINASTLNGLHAALDALVERLVRATGHLVARLAPKGGDRAGRPLSRGSSRPTDG